MTQCQKLLKEEGTARRSESMQQSSTTQSLHLWFLGVAEDCCMLSILLAVPSCFNSFWHGVIPTYYIIFNDFYTCRICSTSFKSILYSQFFFQLSEFDQFSVHTTCPHCGQETDTLLRHHTGSATFKCFALLMILTCGL